MPNATTLFNIIYAHLHTHLHAQICLLAHHSHKAFHKGDTKRKATLNHAFINTRICHLVTKMIDLHLGHDYSEQGRSCSPLCRQGQRVSVHSQPPSPSSPSLVQTPTPAVSHSSTIGRQCSLLHCAKVLQFNVYKMVSYLRLPYLIYRWNFPHISFQLSGDHYSVFFTCTNRCKHVTFYWHNDYDTWALKAEHTEHGRMSATWCRMLPRDVM